MSKSSLNPITRNNKFYSEEDYQYELSLIEEYLEEDLNQVVIVYEVDRLKTNTNSIYKESQQAIRFKPPREIPCMFEIKDSQLKSYDSNNNTGVYSVSGGLTVYIPVFMFEKYNCDIKRGDYLGVQIDTNRMSYFSVNDDGKMNNSNKNYVGAYKTTWRIIEASPIPEEEFNGQ